MAKNKVRTLFKKKKKTAQILRVVFAINGPWNYAYSKMVTFCPASKDGDSHLLLCFLESIQILLRIKNGW